MTSNYYSNKIKLNPDSDYLDCIYNNGIQTCQVYMSHFVGKDDGYYYTHHLNHEKYYSINYEASAVNVVIPYESIEIQLKKGANINKQFVGQNGYIYFITSYIDTDNIFDISDIEEKTNFDGVITDNKHNTYEASCRLWKPINESLRIFCKLKVELRANISMNYFSNVNFTYNNYVIGITSEILDIQIEQYVYSLPFIYADKQIININNEEEIYELKFKAYSFRDEFLILKGNKYNDKLLTQCNNTNSNLICKISKKDLEAILVENGEKFKLIYYNSNIEPVTLNNVLDIIINLANYQKENIYIEMQSLLENNLEKNNFIAFYTNVTNISDIISEEFLIITNISDFTCFLRKYPQRNLLILCNALNEGTFYLGKIEEEIKLDKVNAKYNFFIQPTENYDAIGVDKEGSNIVFVSPDVLNFKSELDVKVIEFFMNNQNETRNISLNPSLGDLSCIDYINAWTKRCFVYKDHFKNKESGYYYVYHLNHLNKYTIFYELPPIYVDLPKNYNIFMKIIKEKNKNVIEVGLKGTLYFVTDYSDEKNIFNIDHVENNKFNT